MKRDLSFILYRKYYSLENRCVEVILKNHRRFKGIFISYYAGDKFAGQSFVTAWHIADEKDKLSLGDNGFGFLIGDIIFQKDIGQIRFSDNTIMKF